MFKRLCAVTAAALLTIGTYAAAVEMREGHPSTYVVQRGDTLWGIAGRFLSKPWLWPEIWQANPQIENPHRIFPGDVISLAYLDGKPVLSTQPGPRSEPAITTIPLSDIEPFLRQSQVVSSLEGLPHVVSLESERLRGAEGQMAYVRGLSGVSVGDTVMLVRPTHHFRLPAERRRLNTIPTELDFRGDETYRDVRSAWGRDLARGESLGYELTRQGLGRVTQVQGDVTLVLLVDSTADVRVGDRVVPAEPSPTTTASCRRRRPRCPGMRRCWPLPMPRSPVARTAWWRSRWAAPMACAPAPCSPPGAPAAPCRTPPGTATACAPMPTRCSCPTSSPAG
jgi:hypothetical protein